MWININLYCYNLIKNDNNIRLIYNEIQKTKNQNFFTKKDWQRDNRYDNIIKSSQKSEKYQEKGEEILKKTLKKSWQGKAGVIE